MRERLQDLYDSCRDAAAMAKRWGLWCRMAKESGVPELVRFAEKKRPRQQEIVKAILDRFLADYDPQAVSGIFIDGRHDGLFTPYLDKPLEDEPLSFSPVPAVDIELVSKLKDICSRLLEG